MMMDLRHIGGILVTYWWHIGGIWWHISDILVAYWLLIGGISLHIGDILVP